MMGLRLLQVVGFSAVLASAAPQWWDGDAFQPLVTSATLQSKINASALLAHAKALESFAYAYPQRNRLMGSKAHNDTVTYIYNQLTAPELNDYYNVTLQPWEGILQVSGTGSLFVNSVNTSIVIAEYSPNGNVTAELVPVANLGCNATDFPGTVAGKIALISRGSCTFLNKSALAGHAGALGAVIYNNIGGGIASMTLSNANSSLGPTVPTVGISRENGVGLLDRIKSGEKVTAKLDVKTVIEMAHTFNVLAETTSGDSDSVIMLGAHSDSVDAGPGINDDGSGSIGILEVAKQLAKYRVNNAVRFGWWSGEEEGLLGSTYYVEHLPDAEKKKVKLYLNFDMIASPNFEYGIFDGDGSMFNMTGPMGSGDIEKLFQDYFVGQKLNWSSIEFNGRSDYDPFIKAGIPAGGVETGAEVNKTEEGVAKYGGWAGVPFDKNYHQAGDNVANLNMTAFLVNTKAIAHGVATYARSLAGVHLNTTGEDAGDDEEDDEDDDGPFKKKRVVRRSMAVHPILKKVKKEKKLWRLRRFTNRAHI